MYTTPLRDAVAHCEAEVVSPGSDDWGPMELRRSFPPCHAPMRSLRTPETVHFQSVGRRRRRAHCPPCRNRCSLYRTDNLRTRIRVRHRCRYDHQHIGTRPRRSSPVAVMAAATEATAATAATAAARADMRAGRNRYSQCRAGNGCIEIWVRHRRKSHQTPRSGSRCGRRMCRRTSSPRRAHRRQKEEKEHARLRRAPSVRARARLAGGGGGGDGGGGGQN